MLTHPHPGFLYTWMIWDEPRNQYEDLEIAGLGVWQAATSVGTRVKIQDQCGADASLASLLG